MKRAMLSAEVPVFRLLFCLRAVPRLVDIVEDKVFAFNYSPTLFLVMPELLVSTPITWKYILQLQGVPNLIMGQDPI